ncbi:hypothetical protein LTR53_005730 [Teratosphaeriaceae sp. CCFEE 6253]|nr:hypothetical protein LTR53_005730 [Teratosphaeriaceae sp. CCFEE 6253]
MPITSKPDVVVLPRAITTFKLDLTDTDRYAFNYFLHNTYPDMLIVSPLKEWLAQAVQLSFDTAPVFYAITAVGCAHHSLPFIIDATLTRHYLDSARVAGLRQYGKALSALQVLLGQASGNSDSVVPVLLMCILFGCFELFEDRSHAAVAHVRYGRSIIAEHRRRAEAVPKDVKQTPLRPPALPERLAETFMGMLESDPASESARSLVDQRGLSHGSRLQTVLPTRFASIEQARAHLDPLLDSATQLRTDLLRLAEERVSAMAGAPFSHAVTKCLALCISRAPDLRAPTTQHLALSRLRESLSSWTAALGPLLSGGTEPATSRALALMQIQHFAANFVLLSLGQTDERYTDDLRPTFVRILDLCEHYILSTSTQMSGDSPAMAKLIQGGFSLEMRILPALYLIVHRCRDPAIRRRAISILQHSERREGLFFSRVLCLSGEAYIEIEEGRVGPGVDRNRRSSTSSDMSHPGRTTSSPQRFAEAAIAGSDVTGNDDRYFLDPVKTTPQSLSLSPQALASPYAEMLVAGNTGPPPSMTMWCGRFAERQAAKGIEIVEYKGRGWPVHMEEVNRAFFAYC